VICTLYTFLSRGLEVDVTCQGAFTSPYTDGWWSFKCVYKNNKLVVFPDLQLTSLKQVRHCGLPLLIGFLCLSSAKLKNAQMLLLELAFFTSFTVSHWLLSSVNTVLRRELSTSNSQLGACSDMRWKKLIIFRHTVCCSQRLCHDYEECWILTVTNITIWSRLRNDLYCVGWGVKLYSIQTIWSDVAWFSNVT